MNWFHQQVCRSGRWRRRLDRELLPSALQGVALAGDVLEVGPEPGPTSEWLRVRVPRLTALEVDSAAPISLQQRRGASGVRVLCGDGSAMPFADQPSQEWWPARCYIAFQPWRWRSDYSGKRGACCAPESVFTGFDGLGSLVFRLAHLGDVYTPVVPETAIGAGRIRRGRGDSIGSSSSLPRHTRAMPRRRQRGVAPS